MIDAKNNNKQQAPAAIFVLSCILEALPHLQPEACIGVDARSDCLELREGLVEADAIAPHQVSEDDGGRAGVASQAVAQHLVPCV